MRDMHIIRPPLLTTNKVVLCVFNFNFKPKSSKQHLTWCRSSHNHTFGALASEMRLIMCSPAMTTGYLALGGAPGRSGASIVS